MKNGLQIYGYVYIHLNILCEYCSMSYCSYQTDYTYRLQKTRQNVLKYLYERESIRIPVKVHQNPRLKFRFREAIEEAQHVCSLDNNSRECMLAWYEVDELEDCMMRQSLKD